VNYEGSATTVGTREYTIEEVLALATVERNAEAVFEGFRVHLDSLRYQVFLRSTVCAHCGLKGTVFLLQQSPGTPPDRAHFNLFGRTPDGTLVMMTKDHIHPRAKGGKNQIANLQTLCAPCNSKKGKSI
jgi:5-methylcytosine-specific restriction endonuclease McrA